MRGIMTLIALGWLCTADAQTALATPGPVEAVVAALDRARESGAIRRLFDERYYLTRRSWTAADGSRPRPVLERLVAVRAFEGGEGFELAISSWTPASLDPTEFRCVVGRDGIVSWGQRGGSWRQEPRLRPADPAFLPKELAEWVVPLLWDQGLPAELLYSQRAEPLSGERDQALVRISPPRGGQQLATVTITDAETERCLEVGAGGPEDGRLLGVRAAALFRGRAQAPRWEELREPVSAEDFAAQRQAWRRSLRATHLELRLVDGRDQQPVGGVEVTLERPDGDVGEVVTPEAGRAHLPHAGLPGIYRLGLRGSGYFGFSCLGRSQRFSHAYRESDGRLGFQFESLVLDLTAEHLQAGLDLTLWPVLTVEGRVLSPAGKPVSGASVRYGLLASDTGRQGLRQLVQTDRQGDFRLETGPGQLLLVVGHPRWQTVVHELEIAEGLSPLRLTLPAGGELQGRVLDEAGRPLPGALVEALAGGAERELGAFDPSLRGRRVQDTTDDLGRYLLRGVRPGAVALRASRLGYRPLLLRGCDVAADAVLEHRLQLAAGGGVGGRFLDAEGRPVSVDGSVQFGPVDAGWSIAVALANQTAFLVEEPTLGRYRLDLDLVGYRRVTHEDVAAGVRDLRIVVQPTD